MPPGFMEEPSLPPRTLFRDGYELPEELGVGSPVPELGIIHGVGTTNPGEVGIQVAGSDPALQLSQLYAAHGAGRQPGTLTQREKQE